MRSENSGVFPAAGAYSEGGLPKETYMSKGMNQKREQKRKPAKTLEEKRAAKKVKRAERATARTL